MFSLQASDSESLRGFRLQALQASDSESLRGFSEEINDQAAEHPSSLDLLRQMQLACPAAVLNKFELQRHHSSHTICGCGLCKKYIALQLLGTQDLGVEARVGMVGGEGSLVASSNWTSSKGKGGGMGKSGSIGNFQRYGQLPVALALALKGGVQGRARAPSL